MDIKIKDILLSEEIMTQLYRAGFISAKIFEYRDIHLWVHAQIITRGISKNKAVLEAEVFFDKSERTIWKAMRSFK